MRESERGVATLGTSVPSVYHGGDLAGAAMRFPQAPRPWLDLSTGINPIPYPLPDLPSDVWTRLTPAADITELEAAAAAHFGAADAARVVAGPGTQALIQQLPRLRPARRVGILGFTYQEHGHVWQAAGTEVTVVEEFEALAAFDVAIIVNPNNPDGRLVHPEDLASLANRMADMGGLLVVDEAFVDVLAGAASFIPHLNAGAIVLRSFGKTWGLAGLRLGFAVAPPALADRLRRDLGPWAISGPAATIGTAAYADRAWLTATIARLARDAARLDRMLADAGFECLGGTPLYRLVAHADAAGWFERLGHAGILTRPFPARRDWLRFGLPGAEADWARLAAALGM
ncbi:MAG: threonine-phosphate decarboxylase CobD [Ancalomicrobiaceae bacterium]|nr:threonine-phosphate decarboxylase CobD [Ancalomicrobiaceae bacterium]